MKIKSLKEKITVRIIGIGVLTFIFALAVSFFIFVPSMLRQAVDEAAQANTEIIQQIDSLHSFIEDYTENLALSVAQNEDIQEYFSGPSSQKKQIASLKLNNLVSSESRVRCVMIISESGLLLDSLNKILEEDYELLRTEWYKKLQKAKFGQGISGVYETGRTGESICSAAYLKKFYKGNQQYTYLVFFDVKNLIRDICVLAEHKVDSLVLIDTDGKAFYMSGQEEETENLLKKAEEGKLSGQERSVRGSYLMKASVNSKWRIVSYVSNRSIFKTFQSYMIGIILVLVMFLILVIGFLSRMLASMLEPIRLLAERMELVARGDLDCRVEIESDDEIGILSRAFNKMVEDLKKSLKIISEKEKKEQQAKFSLLISQIDPHFIYNTINSINYLARRGRSEDVVTVNSALIAILQDRLRVNDIQITDSVRNEKKVIEQYIVIERYMYEGELSLVWEIEEGLMDAQIPKNMIQPLVENALFHGLIDEESGDLNGEIRIRIRSRDQDIVVEVRDNGLGMDEKKLHQVQNETYRPEDRGKRIGLSNIRGRLYYLYGGRDCLEIESEPGKGTCITLLFYHAIGQ